MRIAVLLVPLSLLGCQDVLGGAPDGGGPPPPTGHPVNGPIESPPGYFHLPNGTKATTLYLQPDGVARTWYAECDFTALGSIPWHFISSSTIELDGESGSWVLTFEDGGTARVEPPLFGPSEGAAEIWQPGAACSVCLPGHPLAVVGCATPDAGVIASCCQGGCGGDTAFSAACTYGLVSGEVGNAVAGGNCVCPIGTVSADECSDYPRVFCGGE
jgi:hypothetical protein